MTTRLSVLIPRDASIHTSIECEAERLSNIKQCSIPSQRMPEQNESERHLSGCYLTSLSIS